MVQRNSIDEYVGPNGGFGVADGSYSGVAVEGLDLRTSGILGLRSENGSMNIHASGSLNMTASGALAYSGNDITVIANTIEVTAIDRSNWTAVNLATFACAFGMVNVTAAGGVLNMGGDGIMLNSSMPGGFVNFFGSISGIASDDIHFASSGQHVIRSDNSNVNVFASGDFTVRAFDDVSIVADDLIQVASTGSQSWSSNQGNMNLSTPLGQIVLKTGDSRTIKITGDGGIILATDENQSPLPHSLGTGSISGIASQAIHLASSGQTCLHSTNDSILIAASGGIVNTAGSQFFMNADTVLLAAQNLFRITAGGEFSTIASSDILIRSATANIGLAAVGNISGIADGMACLVSSGTAILGSDNSNVNIAASGNATIDAGNLIALTAGSEIEVVAPDLDGRFSDEIDLVAANDILIAQAADINNPDIAGDNNINLVDQDIRLSANAGIIRLESLGNGSVVSAQGRRGIDLRAVHNASVPTAFSGVSTGPMTLWSSGQMYIASTNGNMIIGSSGLFQMGTPGGSFSITEAGTYTYTSDAGQSYNVLPGGNSTISSQGTTVVAGGVATLITSVAGAVTVTSQFSTTTITSELSDTFVGSKEGQLTLNPWGGSGQLRYEFGPYEAWHTSPSTTSDFFPIPHSGQIVQMIAELAPGGGTPGLQEVYEAGNTLAVKAAGGDLLITADANKTRLGTNSTRPHLHMSGVLSLPVGDPERGDVWMSRHEQLEQPSSATTAAEADALSLGPSTLGVNSGSGIINISTGSGITQLINASAVTINSNTYTAITWDETVGLTAGAFRDSHYAHLNSGGTGAEDVRILVDGLYRVHYHLNFDLTVAPVSHDSLGTAISVNGTIINPGKAYAILQRGANAGTGDERTLCATVMLNLDAGDILNVEGRLEDNNGYTIQTIVDECWMTVEYIGPKRSW